MKGCGCLILLIFGFCLLVVLDGGGQGDPCQQHHSEDNLSSDERSNQCESAEGLAEALNAYAGTHGGVSYGQRLPH